MSSGKMVATVFRDHKGVLPIDMMQ
jgi:hypothetical protein